MVLPCLGQGVPYNGTFVAYVPSGIWYNGTDYYYGKIESKGEMFSLPGSFRSTNVLVKAGSVVSVHPVDRLLINRVKSTKDLVKHPIDILIAPDASGYAEGTFLVDDGASVDYSSVTKEYSIQL